MKKNKIYLASFLWSTHIEPLMVGRNKNKLKRAAKDLIIKSLRYGSIYDAMISCKITLNDIHVEEIEYIRSDNANHKE